MHLMNNRDELDKFIHSIDPGRWLDVVSRLDPLGLRPEHAEPGILVLLNLWPDMPERPWKLGASGNFTGKKFFRRVILRLLEVLEDASAIEAAVLENQLQCREAGPRVPRSQLRARIDGKPGDSRSVSSTRLDQGLVDGFTFTPRRHLRSPALSGRSCRPVASDPN